MCFRKGYWDENQENCAIAGWCAKMGKTVTVVRNEGL